MAEAFHRKFDNLQGRYSALKNEMLALDQSGLNRPPRPGKWSALQIIYHLFLSESLSVNYLGKKINSGPHPSVGIKESVRFELLRLALFTPVKFKAPPAVGENIPDLLDKEKLFNDFDQVREQLQKIVMDFPESRRGEAIYKHPFIGYLNMNQTVGFLFLHFAHHEKQIRAIIS